MTPGTVFTVPMPICEDCGGTLHADLLLHHNPGCQGTAWMATDERYNRKREAGR